MHLNNTQFLKLIAPFIFAGTLYVFSDDITQDADSLFPTIEQYSNSDLDIKANIYLNIERDRDIYGKIENKLKTRKQNSSWISDNLLYNNKKKIDKKNLANQQEKHSLVVKKQTWNLQILYPNKKIAIINSKIVNEGSFIDGAEVKKIENERVLLKIQKGYKWLTLFQ